MKLHLPHRLQAALMAAIASVSFTTVSSATLAAGTFAFFAGQAGAEDLTHDPILTQQLDHAKQIEFGKLSLSETGAEQVESSVAAGSFGSGDVTSVDAAATLGGDIVDAVLCEGYSEAGGSWQADAAGSSTLDPSAASEFVTAEGLAAMENDEPVFTVDAAAATSALDLAPQQDNSYYSGTTATSTTASSGSAVSAPSVGGGAGAVSLGGATGSAARPVVMKTAGVTLQDETATETATQGSVSVNMQGSADEEDALTRQEEVIAQPRLAAAMAEAQPSLAAASQTFAEKHGTSLGNVQFVGDSITHGSDYGGTHNGASYRWPMHKIWTDDGVSYTESGYHVGNLNSGNYKPVYSGGSSYGGVDWENRHSAQASGRAYELINGSSRYDGNTPASLAANYPTDVYFLLIGTNDTLSDYANKGGVGAEGNLAKFSKDLLGYDIETGSFTGSSRMDTITNAFITNNGKNNGEVVVLSIPTWSPNHSNNNTAADFEAMRRYNTYLEKWCDQKGNSVTFVNTNLGIVDVANTAKPWAGVVSMFNDGLHPSGQGDLIMAGNVSKQLGYAGRSVGLDRAANGTAGTTWSAAADTSITVASGTQNQVVEGASFTTSLGYTVDFGAVYGDGSANGWSASGNALSVQVGDGSHTGTLTFSEAYVMWGSTILYSRNNSVAEDNFRIAYVNQSLDSTDNVSAGYYVWMGDMLIGEALTAGSDSFNGIQLSSTGAAGTISNLTWADKAYAPTTTGFVNDGGAFKLSQVSPMPSHDNPTKQGIRSDISWTATTDKFALPSGQTESAATLYKEFSSTVGAAYTGAANANYTGDIAMRYTGTTNMDVRQSVFGVYNATVTGNVYMQFDSADTEYKSFTGVAGQQTSVTASYGGNITQSYTAVYNAGIFKFAVRGGTFTNNTISNGSYSYVNGGTFEGGVYGGGINGTITGGTHVVITGGVISNGVYGGGTGGTINGGTEVTITGGVITGGVHGGGTGGTINGTTNVTIEGNLASIGGNISAQYVTLKNVARNADGYSDGFDHYSGTITGENTITLDNYTVADMGASLVTQNLRAINNTSTTIHNLHLTACDIKAEAGSSLTLADTLNLGNTTTYSGHIVIEDGVSITFGGAAGQGAYSDGENGFMVGGTFELFKKDADAIDGTGLFNAAGQSLTSANTDTFKGVGSLNGYTFTYDAATGTLSATGESGDTDTYYINSGTVVYGGAHSAKDITTATTLTLQPSTSATLELAEGLKDTCTGGIVVTQEAHDANIKIDAGVTLDASAVHANAGVKLQGEGTYKLAAGTAAATPALPSNITLGDSWRGIVELSGSPKGGHNFSGLSNANSFVKLTNVSTWITKNSTVNANLILDGTDSDGDRTGGGLIITGADNGGSYKFTGIIKGSGDLVYTQTDRGDRSSVFYLNGDLSGWTGNFVNYNGNKNGTHPSLRFEGTSNVVMGGGIIQKQETSQSNGALDVYFGGSGTSSVTVKGAVVNHASTALKLYVNADTVFESAVTNITGLDVAAGKTATFNGTTTFNENAVSTLRGTMYNGGAMTLAGSITVNTADLGAYELFSAGTDGFDGAAGHAGSGHLNGAGQYYLVKGTGTSTLTNNATISGASLVTSGAPDNAVVFSATASGSSKLYYVNGDFAYSADMAADTSGYVIGAGHTLTVGSDVETVLKTSHGAGTLVVSATTTLAADGSTAAAPYKTGLTGTLKVNDSVTLQFGNSKDNDYFDMSSVSAVELGSNSQLKFEQHGPMSLNNVSVAAGTATIQFNDTFNQDQENLRLTGVTTVNEGSTLKLTSSWKTNMTIDELSGEGTLSIPGGGDEKHTYNLNGTDGVFGTIDMARADSREILNINGDSSIGILKLAGEATVNVAAGVSVSLNNEAAEKQNGTRIQGTLNVNEGATLTVASNSHLEVSRSGDHANTALNINGGDVVAEGALYVGRRGDGAGYINMTSGSLTTGTIHTAWGGEINLQGGSLEITGGRLDTSSVDRASTNGGSPTSGVNINLGTAPGANLTLLATKGDWTLDNGSLGDKTLKVGSITVDSANTGTVQLKAAKMQGGTLENNSKLVLNNVDLAAGSTSIITGTGTTTISTGLTGSGAISLDGGTLDVTRLSSLATTGALTLNGGTLALGGETLQLSGALNLNRGTVDITALMEAQAATPAMMAEGDSATTLTLLTTAGGITGGTSGLKLTGDSGRWTGATLSVEGNSLVLTMAEMTELIWNAVDGNWSYNEADQNWHTAAAPSLAFISGMDVRFGEDANGHTATLTEAVTAGVITIENGVSVTIKDNGNNLTGTLKGSGTYALAAGDSTLPTGVVKDDAGWIGTVKLSGLSQVANLDLNAYGHAGSKVELDGVSGHFKSGNTTFNPMLVLSGDGLTITDAYSGTTYTFAGGVSGDGNFTTNIGTSATNQTYKFSGDVSGWKGAFESLQDGKTTTLMFTDNAKEVNATLGQTSGGAGTINLTTETDVTFKKATYITGTTTISGAKSVTFAGGTGELGTIAMSGNNTDSATKLRFSVDENTGSGSYTASTIDMSGNNNTGLKWVVVDEDVELHLTGHNLGPKADSSLLNSWGVRNGGLEVNGTLTADGMISMDSGTNNSTLKGTGTIYAAGLNISNGSTTTLQGGLTLDITTSAGIWKRANNSTLNLADVTLAANSADWALNSNLGTVNLTSAAGTTFSAAGDHTLTVNKTMDGAGKLVKDGEGTVKLMTANNYTGGTEIKQGTLAVANATALNTGAVSIAQDATLEAAVTGVTVAGALSGEGNMTYTGTEAGTVNLNGSVADYTGTFTNKSAQDVTLNLPGGTGRDIKFDIDRAADAGKVNMNLQDTNKDYYLRGTANVNNISHATNVSLLLKDAADVTATGTVRTGRLVVGETAAEKDASFTLSGSSAMLNKADGSHEYNAAVQGYGTFAVADGARESLTGTLTGFHGTFEASGANSVLTLGSALASDTDLLATNGGTIVLGRSGGTVDSLTVNSGSTIKLGGYGDSALTVNSLTLGSGSILDLTGLSLTGGDDVVLVKGGTIRESDLGGAVTLLGVMEGSSLMVRDNKLVLTMASSDDFIWTGGNGTWSDVKWHKAADPDTQLEFTDYAGAIFKAGESTVELDGDVHASKTTLQKGSVVKVERGEYQLTTSLAGNGTFVLDTNSVSLPAGVTLDSANWDGIVRLTSTENKANIDLRPLVTEDSWIEFNGFTGYTNSWATQAGGGYNIPLSQNIILTDTAEGQPAWIWTAMGSNADPLYECYQSYVTGDWSGNGTLAVKYPTSTTAGNTSAQSFRFSGDISGWDGKITVHKNSAALTNIGLYFQDKATEVNVDIEKPRGQVFVHVGDGNQTFATSFNGTVAATSFEVKANATATITGQTTLDGVGSSRDALYGAGNLKVDSHENTVTVNGASTIKGTTTVDSGTLLLNGGGDMGAVVVNGGNFTTTGAEDITLDSLTVTGGIAHVGNTGDVDLGAITLGGGSLRLNTTVEATSLATTGGTLTFAGADMFTTTGAISLGSGTTIDLANITYRADQAEQRIVLATSESGSITLGDTYNFTNSKYDSATYSLEKDGNDLVLVVNMEVGDWPADTKVRYTYTDAHGQQQTHYDIATGTSAHGYQFNKADGGVVAFNPDLFTDGNNHTYTDSTMRIDLNSDTTFIVEEGDKVIMKGQVFGNNSDDTGHSGAFIKEGAGTLEIALNAGTLHRGSDEINRYEGSVEVKEGTLHVLAHSGYPGDEASYESALAGHDGAHVEVGKHATLILDPETRIVIPNGNENVTGSGVTGVSIEAGKTKQAIFQNVMIDQTGIRPDAPEDGGRASIEADMISLADIHTQNDPLRVTAADILVSDLNVNGQTTISDSHVKVSSELRFTNTEHLWTKIENNSDIQFSGNWAEVLNTDVDKTSKINAVDGVNAFLMGSNKVEISAVEQGGIANREINEEARTVTYDSDQYKGMTLGWPVSDPDWIAYYESKYGQLALAITLPDIDLPEDLTGYTFTVIMNDLDSSLLFPEKGFQFLDGLNVDLYIPQYTGSQWEKMVADVKGMYDTETGNTIFMFSNVVVPEPTTGTLSLLALAALCARRRRKA